MDRTAVRAISLVLAFASSAAAGTLSIGPSADGTLSQVPAGGAFNSLDTPVFYDQIGPSQVGVLEFDLSAIPPGSVITSANLNLLFDVVQQPTAQTANFYGYAGDGVVSLSDATVPANVVGSLSTTTVGAHSIAISPSFIQSTLASDSTIGLLAVFTSPSPFNQMAFYSSRETLTSDRPVLSVTYGVPEPAGSVLAILGASFAALALGLRARAQRHSAVH